MTGTDNDLRVWARRPLPRLTRVFVPVVALGLAAALAACGSDTEPTSGEQSPSPSVTQEPSATPDESPSAPATAVTPGERNAVALYFAGKTPMGDRLFREFQQLEGDKIAAAAAAIDGGADTVDPDYRTLWPGGTVSGAKRVDGAIEVTLAGDAFTVAPDGMSKKDAALAIQQMVHTLQAAAGETLPVQFVRASGPTSLFGIDVAEPVKRGDWLDLLSLVNVTTPAQGTSTSSDTLKVSGVASADEANVVWRVEQGGRSVLDGFVTAEGWMDKLYPWEDEIDISSLKPGTYTFVASNSDQAKATEDSKEFTVK